MMVYSIEAQKQNTGQEPRITWQPLREVLEIVFCTLKENHQSSFPLNGSPQIVNGKAGVNHQDAA